MTEGDVIVNLGDFSLKWIGKVNFTTDPVLFFGKGDGWFNLSNLNVTTRLNFDLGPNMLPKIKLIHSNVSISNKSISMGFNGTNDLFQLLNMTQGFALPLILGYIQGEMSNTTKQTIEETINGVLASLPHEITIPGTNIAFDFGFVFSPKVDERKYVSMPIKGSAKCNNATSCKNYEPKPLPPKKTDYKYGTGSLQLHLSDYIVSSIFVAAYEDSLIKITITPEMVHNITGGAIELNTKLLGVFIPEISRRYGLNRSVTIKVAATGPPLLTITPEYMKGKKIDNKINIVQTDFLFNFTVFLSEENRTEDMFGANLHTEFDVLVHYANK